MDLNYELNDHEGFEVVKSLQALQTHIHVVGLCLAGLLISLKRNALLSEVRFRPSFPKSQRFEQGKKGSVFAGQGSVRRSDAQRGNTAACAWDRETMILIGPRPLASDRLETASGKDAVDILSEVMVNGRGLFRSKT